MTPRIHRQFAQERVHRDLDFTQAVATEMTLLGLSRAFIVTSPSVARDGGPASVLRQHLRDQCVGIYDGCRAHSPRECGLAAAHGFREAGADVFVAIGGGSVIDTAKLAQLCLWRDITTSAQLDANRRESDLDASVVHPHRAGLPRTIAIPTTFSAAEFTYFAGIKNEERGFKESFAAWHLIPRTVVLDPAAAAQTPVDILLATGFKALDHAIEAHLSVLAEPVYGPMRVHAVHKLLSGMDALYLDPSSLSARSDCQAGMWASMVGSMGFGVGGVSHTLGAILGGHAGVSHGTTSCITLPAVLDQLFVDDPRLQELHPRRTGQPDATLSQILRRNARRYGLPTTLTEVGVSRSDFEAITDKVMRDKPAFQRHFKEPLTRSHVLEIVNTCI